MSMSYVFNKMLRVWTLFFFQISLSIYVSNWLWHFSWECVYMHMYMHIFLSCFAIKMCCVKWIGWFPSISMILTIWYKIWNCGFLSKGYIELSCKTTQILTLLSNRSLTTCLFYDYLSVSSGNLDLKLKTTI